MIKYLLKPFKRLIEAFLGSRDIIPLTEFEVVSKARCFMSARYYVLVKIERQRCRVVYNRPYRFNHNHYVYRVRSEIIGDSPDWFRDAASYEEVYPGLRWDVLDSAFAKNMLLEKVISTVNDILLLRMLESLTKSAKRHYGALKDKS